MRADTELGLSSLSVEVAKLPHIPKLERYCRMAALLVARDNSTDNRRRVIRRQLDGLVLGLLVDLVDPNVTWTPAQCKKLWQIMRDGFVYAYGGEHQARRYQMNKRDTVVALRDALSVPAPALQ